MGQRVIELPPAVQKILYVVVPPAVVIAGAAILWHGWREARWAKGSPSWPKASGRIEYSRADSHHNADGQITHFADVRYTYSAGSEPITNNRVAFGMVLSQRHHHACATARKYPVGRTVTVFYHPDDPRISCLEPGETRSLWYMPLLGLWIMIGGSIGAVWAWSRSRGDVSVEQADDHDASCLASLPRW